MRPVTDLEGEDDEGVPEERHRVALPGLDALEAPAAHVAEGVAGVVGGGEEHGQQTRQQHAVEKHRHRTAGGEEPVSDLRHNLYRGDKCTYC